MNRTAILTAITLVFAVAGAQVNAASFAKYDGIKGESNAASDTNHEKWINLDSVSWAKSKQRMVGDFPREGLARQKTKRVRADRRGNRARPGIEHEDIGHQ